MGETEWHPGARTCAWCGLEITYRGTGRPPSYCSKAHRNRAWEVRTAEARLGRDISAGRASTEPVREVIREVVTVTKTATGPAAVPSGAGQWLQYLDELARQVRDGNLGRQHWYHERIMHALDQVARAVDGRYPGGLAAMRRR
jgi:hypothetical protein